MLKYLSIFSLSFLSISAFADCKSEFDKQNYVDAFGLCQDESQDDDESSFHAQFIMAQIYAKGLGVGRDTTQAINFLSQSAQNGHTEAMFNLAMAFELGKGVEKNLNAAFDWQLKAAENNWVKAQRKVAKMYEHGVGTQENPLEAYQWYLKAAEQGDADSQLEVGAILMQGLNLSGKVIPQDTDKGLYWIRASAEQNHPEAQFAVASLVIDDNPEEGIRFYKKAAKNGNKYSMHNLASIYLKGEVVKQDLEMSQFYAQMAVDVGQKSSQSILNHIAKLENKLPLVDETQSKETDVNSQQTRLAQIPKNVVVEDKPSQSVSNDASLIELLKNTNYVIQLASMEKQSSVQAFIKKYNIEDTTHILFIKNRYLVLSEPKEFLSQARELQSSFNSLLNASSWLRKTPSILALIGH